MMRLEVLDILLCPRCEAGNLQLRPGHAPIADGRSVGLSCDHCNSLYCIRDGVPDLLIGAHSLSVQNAFSQQWKLRQKGIIAEDEEALFFDKISTRATQIWSTLFPSGNPYGVILDAGCGTGDLTIELASRFPQVKFIGMDFSETIYDNAKRANIKNIVWIRGDVSNPPFKRMVFDGIFCSGVLHHTSSSPVAFGKIAKIVKTGGRFFVWLYPLPHETRTPKFWTLYYWMRDWLFIGIGHYLPSWLLAILLRIVLLPSLLRGKAYYDSLTFLMFDNIAPKYQHRHSKREIETWYLEEGFCEVFQPWDGAYVATKSRTLNEGLSAQRRRGEDPCSE